MSEPRNHHYVPQFYLRAFATDDGKKKIGTLARSGDFAVWAERSIATLGCERDLYVHMRNGIPVSTETRINTNVEMPISQSETWRKIVSGRSDLLDSSDKPILYSLIRHLEVRTLTFMDTLERLKAQAEHSDNSHRFSDEERFMYALVRDPNLGKMMLNTMSASLDWTKESYHGCGISIIRTRIPIWSSTAPVLPIPVPYDSRIHTFADLAPHQHILPLNRTTIATLVLGDFCDGFANSEVSDDVAKALRRYYIGQFLEFASVRHLITDFDQQFLEDMEWAGKTEKFSGRRAKFRN